MFLYLVRHGEAKPEEEDPSRGLTEKGVQDIRKVASFLRGGQVRVPKIFHSGKTRALQTAEALADPLHPPEGISLTDGLAPLDDPRIWGERLSNQREDLMLVGHLPHLGRLSALLLCGNSEQPIVSFQTGGAVCLERGESGRWSIAWIIVPGIL